MRPCGFIAGPRARASVAARGRGAREIRRARTPRTGARARTPCGASTPPRSPGSGRRSARCPRGRGAGVPSRARPCGGRRARARPPRSAASAPPRGPTARGRWRARPCRKSGAGLGAHGSTRGSCGSSRQSRTRMTPPWRAPTGSTARAEVGAPSQARRMARLKVALPGADLVRAFVAFERSSWTRAGTDGVHRRPPRHAHRGAMGARFVQDGAARRRQPRRGTRAGNRATVRTTGAPPSRPSNRRGPRTSARPERRREAEPSATRGGTWTRANRRPSNRVHQSPRPPSGWRRAPPRPVPRGRGFRPEPP